MITIIIIIIINKIHYIKAMIKYQIIKIKQILIYFKIMIMKIRAQKAIAQKKDIIQEKN